MLSITIIPRGADAQLALISRQQSGQIGGRAMLTLDLRSVTIDGQVHDLVSSRVTETSGSRGTRSAQVIGGTAALGTIIGAIAGGGRGAAIGAPSGAGLGTGVQVLTSGERVRIPSETRLTFSLQAPVTL
jgi:hypothetical protein